MSLKELVNFIIMKKLILILLFIPLVSFGQNDFRKMFWGESQEVLKEKYPDAEFVSEKGGGMTTLSNTDSVLGMQATVTYMFDDNKLFAGAYLFYHLAYLSGDEKLKNFNSVSKRLNDKYEMERDDNWYKENYKDRPEHLGHAIALGDVDLSEKGKKGDNTMIAHTVNKNEHILGFVLIDGLEAIQKSMDDDI